MSKKRKRGATPSQTSQPTSEPPRKSIKTAQPVEAENDATANPAPEQTRSSNLDAKTSSKPPTHHENAKSTSKPKSISTPLRDPEWLYLHLAQIAPRVPGSAASTLETLDETTLRMHLLSALSTYLGDTGAAVPVDILKVVDPPRSPTKSSGAAAYIRIPHPDGPLFIAALTSWGGSGAVAGYRVMEQSPWLACLNLGDAEEVGDLFDFAAG